MQGWQLIKYSAVASIITNMGISGEIQPAKAEKLSANLLIAQDYRDLRSQQLDGMADRIFNERHPELGGRKIRPYETELAREWAQIRRCEAIVDYIFYQRHPELGGRKIRPDEKALAREWQSIYNNVDGCF